MFQINYETFKVELSSDKILILSKLKTTSKKRINRILLIQLEITGSIAKLFTNVLKVLAIFSPEKTSPKSAISAIG